MFTNEYCLIELYEHIYTKDLYIITCEFEVLVLCRVALTLILWIHFDPSLLI